MAAPSDNDNIPVDTLDCITECKKAFSGLLDIQSSIYKNRRRSKVLTDRDVRNAYDTLMEGKDPNWVVVCVSHALEICGGGLVAFAWHYWEVHADENLPTLFLMACGAIMFVTGIAAREKFAK